MLMICFAVVLQKVGRGSVGKQEEDKMNHIEELQAEFDKLSQTLRSQSTSSARPSGHRVQAQPDPQVTEYTQYTGNSAPHSY